MLCFPLSFLPSFSCYYSVVTVVAKCYICDRLLNQQVKNTLIGFRKRCGSYNESDRHFINSSC